MKVSLPSLTHAVLFVFGCSLSRVQGFRARRLSSNVGNGGRHPHAAQVLLDDITGVKAFNRGPYVRKLMQQDPHAFLKQQGDKMLTTVHDQIDPALSFQRTHRPPQQELHRHLQGDGDLCESLTFAFGGCTQEEFCQDLETLTEDATPGFDIEITCEGDILDGNYTIVSTGESCFYMTQGVAGAYDATKFTATNGDFCIFLENVLEVVGEVETETATYSYSRGGPDTVFTVNTNTKPCDPADPEGDACEECTGATLNGQACASCVACDEFSSFSDLEYSCAAIDPAFVSTCMDDDDAVIDNFLAGSGAFCFWENVVDGNCTLAELCNTAKIAFSILGEDFDCVVSGSPAGEWSVEIIYGEYCIYNSTTEEYSDDDSLEFDSDMFDPAQDGCFKEKETINGNMGEVTTVAFIFMMTRPVVGTLEESYTVVPCTDENRTDDDDAFLPTFCESTDCPELTINGVMCTSDCETCTDEFGAFPSSSCTNLDPSLTEECESDVDFLQETLFEYFKANPMSAAPTKSPTTMTPTKTPTTETPTATPNSAAMDTFIPSTKWFTITCAAAAALGLAVF